METFPILVIKKTIRTNLGKWQFSFNLFKPFLTPPHCIEMSVANKNNWAVMNVLKSIHLSCFYEFEIRFCIRSDIVIIFVFHILYPQIFGCYFINRHKQQKYMLPNISLPLFGYPAISNT